MKKIFGLGILLLAFSVSICAQIQNKTKHALFSGHVNRPAFAKDSIRVVFIKDFMTNIIRQFPVFSVPVDKKGNFKFQLEELSGPGKITLHYVGEATTLIGDFIVEPGDDIRVSVSFKADEPQTVFSGRGVEKYQVRQKIELEKKVFNQKRDKSGSLYEKKEIPALFSMHRSSAVAMLTALDQYKSKLRPEIYEFMKGEFTSYPVVIWYLTLKGMFDENTNAQDKSEGLKYLNDLSGAADADELNDLAQSYNYIGRILEKEKIKIWMSGNGQKVDFKQMYENLKNSYSGILREHLLASHLLETYRQLNLSFADPLDFEYCLKDALDLVQSPVIKQEIAKSIGRNSRGSEVYNFSLPDTTGTIRSLSEFKGKVVMLDMWNTGCTGCAIFAKYFRDIIYPEFKDNQNFTVISINTDKNRSQWMKSLYGGRYTQPDHVNLNISNDQNDPFIKYYQVVAYPFLLLIDKQGKVYAPFTIHTMDKLSAMIREALSKP